MVGPAMKETAQQAGKTVGTVASTARLTKDYAVAPAVRVTALMLAGREVVKIFTGKGHARTRAEERRRKQAEMQRAETLGTVSGGD